MTDVKTYLCKTRREKIKNKIKRNDNPGKHKLRVKDKSYSPMPIRESEVHYRHTHDQLHEKYTIQQETEINIT